MWTGSESTPPMGTPGRETPASPSPRRGRAKPPGRCCIPTRLRFSWSILLLPIFCISMWDSCSLPGDSVAANKAACAPTGQRRRPFRVRPQEYALPRGLQRLPSPAAVDSERGRAAGRQYRPAGRGQGCSAGAAPPGASRTSRPPRPGAPEVRGHQQSRNGWGPGRRFAWPRPPHFDYTGPGSFGGAAFCAAWGGTAHHVFEGGSLVEEIPCGQNKAGTQRH